MYKLEKLDAALIIFFRKTSYRKFTGKNSTRITNSCLKMKCHFRAASTMCIAHEDGTTPVSQISSAHIKKTKHTRNMLCLGHSFFTGTITKSSQLPKPWNITRTRDTEVKQMPNRNTLGALGFV